MAYPQRGQYKRSFDLFALEQVVDRRQHNHGLTKAKVKEEGSNQILETMLNSLDLIFMREDLHRTISRCEAIDIMYESSKSLVSCFDMRIITS